MTPRRDGLRLIAWGVLPALLAGPLLAVLHETESRHRFCSQHGVVEEAADAEVAGPGALAPARPGAGPVLRGGEAVQDGGHARCAFHCGTPPRSACPSPLGVIALAPPPPIPGPHLVAELAALGTQIVRFAPKTSPPGLDRLL